MVKVVCGVIGRKELNCEMTSLAVVAPWQDAAVEVRDEAQSLRVASTGLANESLSGTAAVTERKITYIDCLRVSHLHALLYIHTFI